MAKMEIYEGWVKMIIIPDTRVRMGINKSSMNEIIPDTKAIMHIYHSWAEYLISFSRNRMCIHQNWVKDIMVEFTHIRLVEGIYHSWVVIIIIQGTRIRIGIYSSSLKGIFQGMRA